MLHASHASHIGGAYSCIDILATLYGAVAHVYPSAPKDPVRDRIVLSKGHAGSALYAILAESGFFATDLLKSYYSDGSVFSGHISHRGVPGVEFSTGSLGQGVCVACGMALSAKIRGQKHHVYAIIGDGESEEGSVWEMALFAAHNKLDNFTVIVDANGLQAMGECVKETGMGRHEEKWLAFGWNVVSVADGNDCEQLLKAFSRKTEGMPNLIVAHTVKGKGVSFMENEIIWHYRDPQGEDYENAVRELERSGGHA